MVTEIRVKVCALSISLYVPREQIIVQTSIPREKFQRRSYVNEEKRGRHLYRLVREIEPHYNMAKLVSNLR